MLFATLDERSSCRVGSENGEKDSRLVGTASIIPQKRCLLELIAFSNKRFEEGGHIWFVTTEPQTSQRSTSSPFFVRQLIYSDKDWPNIISTGFEQFDTVCADLARNVSTFEI